MFSGSVFEALGQFYELYEFIAQPKRVIASGRAGQCSGVAQAHAASVAAIALELLGEGGDGGGEAQVVAGRADSLPMGRSIS